MSDFREEEKLGKAYDSHLTRRLMGYMKPYKAQVWLALLLTLVVTPLEALPPALFLVALDWYIVPVTKGTLSFAAGMRGLGLVTLINLAALQFRDAIFASARDAKCRPENNVRLAQGNFRAPASSAHEFLR
jgi:ABC-type multidrug transport system fused ATPase/permease subunit